MKTSISLTVLLAIALLVCPFVLAQAPFATAADGAAHATKLFLADVDNDRIWIMDLETRAITGSFPAPVREVGADALPIGLGLLDGTLYVNNFNFVYECGDDDLFALDAYSGVVLGRAPSPGCNPLDGMASIPEQGLLAAIEITIWSSTGPERLHLFKPSLGPVLTLTPVGIIDIDVPGETVRGLAYLEGRLYIAEADTGSIYIYRLDLTTMTVAYEGSIYTGTGVPGLATLDASRLVAYDSENRQLLIVEASAGGGILERISLDDAGVGGVFALESDYKPVPVLRATLRVPPNSLGNAGDGVLAASLELPEGYDASDIDLSTLRLTVEIVNPGDGVPADRGQISGGRLIVKFGRPRMQFTVTGQLLDGTPFEGTQPVEQ